MVDAHYGVVAPHSAQGPVCSAACVQAGRVHAEFFIQEMFDDFNEPWEKEIVTHPVEVVGGYIEISERPGLGIDLNIEEILRHPYQQENALPLFKRGWEQRRTNDSVGTPGLARRGRTFARTGHAIAREAPTD